MNWLTPQVYVTTSQISTLSSQNTEKFRRLIWFAINELQKAENRKNFWKKDFFSDAENCELNELVQSFKNIEIIPITFSFKDLPAWEKVFYFFDFLLRQSNYPYDPSSPSNKDFITSNKEDKYEELNTSEFFEDSEILHSQIIAILERYNRLTWRSHFLLTSIIDRFALKLSEAQFSSPETYIDTFSNQQLYPLLSENEEDISEYDLNSLISFLKLLIQEELLSIQEYTELKEVLPKRYALYVLSERLYINWFFTGNNKIWDDIIDYYESIWNTAWIDRLQSLENTSETLYELLYDIIEIIQTQQWYERSDAIFYFLEQALELRFVNDDEYASFLSIYDDDPEYILNETLLRILYVSNIKDIFDLLSMLWYHLLDYYKNTNSNTYDTLLTFLEFYSPSND